MRVGAIVGGVMPPNGNASAIPPTRIEVVGYSGAAQHTYTAACDGFHPAGPCKSEAPITIWPGGGVHPSRQES